MFSARLENSQGESIMLSGMENNWQIDKIDGLAPVNANLFMTDLAGLDGARFNSATLTTRNIVITLALRGNVEENRQRLYRFCRTKEMVTFFFQNDNRSVYVGGYVETADVDLFVKSERLQISIICPDSYFKSTQSCTAIISHDHPLFFFPFAIDEDDPIEFSSYADEGTRILNNSETSTGFTARVEFLAAASSFVLQNASTNEKIMLVYQFLSGDVVTINTNSGEKAIRLKRGDADINLFSALDVLESQFVQLASGANVVSVLVDGGSGQGRVNVTLAFAEKYRGV